MEKRNTKCLLRALNGDSLDVPPVWLMRQAGRYLPEYRRVRERAGSFLNLCYTPELAEEVSLQPLRRYDLDAVILFSDILLVPQAMGLHLSFVDGEGPNLAWPNGRIDLDVLKPVDEIDETLAPVYETVRRLSKSVSKTAALIGFAGAPWTVATYMIAGRGTLDQGPARALMYGDSRVFEKLIDRITEATIHYLSRQIDAGAEVVKLFDSWAGTLASVPFRDYAVKPMQKIVSALRRAYPDTPIVGFPRGAGARYSDYAAAVDVQGIAVDAQTPLAWARKFVCGKALQGNLDPLLLAAGGRALKEEARRIRETMADYPFIFNLGHGVVPETDPRHVDQLLEALHA